MTPKEFADEMSRIFPKDGYDAEAAHDKADKLIIKLLKSIGYGKGAKIFDEAKKWYA